MKKKLKTKKYTFKGKIWKYTGPTAWHFVTLPKTLTKTIRKNHGLSEEGWGRLKTVASIGNSSWQTAIWYDSKFASYLLPVKASVRKAEGIGGGISVKVTLVIQVEDLRFVRWLNVRR